MADSAMISTDTRYRYTLGRDTRAQGAEGTVLFVMLNPSTADANMDDPTIRRCLGYARLWGYARLTVGNLYALRATDPEQIARAADPVGPGNDEWLDWLAHDASEIVAAWGAHRMAALRAPAVLELLKGHARVMCLGQTRSRAPRHPLYVAGDQPRELLAERSPGL